MDPMFRLGLYLWRSGLMEGVGAGIFFKLARWDWLDPADRGQARVFAEQEVGHRTLLLDLARELMPTRPDAYLTFPTMPVDLALALAVVHQAERLTMDGFRRMTRFGQQIGHLAFADAYTRIAAEEGPHIVWGRRILRELRCDPETKAAMRGYLADRPVSRRFRTVAQDRPW